MSCILCLENGFSLEEQIQISSTEGTLLDIQRIIEMHFWLQIDTMESLSHSTFVCRPCWQLVLPFHQFYLSVQHAHELQKEMKQTACKIRINDLENKVPSTISPTHSSPPQQLELSRENIKFELDKVEADIEDAAPPKKRRGRPPKQKEAKREKIIVAESSTIDADEFLKNIKSEALQEDFIDVNELLDCEGEGGEEHTDEPLAENDSSDCDYEPEEDGLLVNKIKKPKKIGFCRQTLVSKQSDEFIAENYKLSCCLCHSPLADFSELKAHFRVKHQARGYALCCGKKFLRRGLLCDHIHLHQDPQYFKCTRCEKVLANRRCLELHLKGHEDTRERIYHCEVCPKSFYRHSIYLRHIMLHVPEEEKKFKCSQCDKPFATKYLMTQHLKLVHLNMYAKMCDVCGKSIRGRDALRRHQEEHEGVQQAPIQCDLCGFTLTSKYGLARHKRVMHTEGNLQSQVCPICSKVSKTFSAHQRHMEYMHTMQRKHACPMCDKAFKRPTDLKEHMTTHTGEVLYTCPHCPKTFNSNANMHSHRKKMHRKEWEEKRQQKYNLGHKLRLEKQQQTLPVLKNDSPTTAAAITSNNSTKLS